MKSTSTAGIILSGGRSRRMGSDKACIDLCGLTALERVYQSLATVVNHIVISCRSDQELNPPGNRAVFRYDELPEIGPLGGLIGSFRHLRDAGYASAIIAACDQPLVSPDVFSMLQDSLASIDASDGATCVALTDATGIHPFPGIYDLHCLELMERNVSVGNYRLLDWLSGCNPLLQGEAHIRTVDADMHCLINMNAPAQVERIRRILQCDA